MDVDFILPFLCFTQSSFLQSSSSLFVRNNISGEVAGFFNLGGVENDKLRITEAAASNPFAAASLLRAVVAEARKRCVDLIYVNSYRDDRFARMCLLAGGEIRHCAGQVRSYSNEPEDEDCIYLVDVVLCFQQLLPELERRLKNFSGKLPEAICIKMEKEITLTLTSSIEVHEGKIESVPICQFSRPALTQAVMGYASGLEAAARYPNCDVPPAARSIVSALLPVLEPHQEYEPWGFASVRDFGLIP